VETVISVSEVFGANLLNRRLYLLTTMIALAAVTPPLRRVAFGQIPEAPGPYAKPDGSIPNPIDILRGEPLKIWATPKPAPSADSASDTINLMERARTRASGTPVSEPTARSGLSDTQ
jgi:hypothetical protein